MFWTRVDLCQHADPGKKELATPATVVLESECTGKFGIYSGSLATTEKILPFISQLNPHRDYMGSLRTVVWLIRQETVKGPMSDGV